MSSVIADFLYEQGVKMFFILLAIFAELIFLKTIISIVIESRKEKKK